MNDSQTDNLETLEIVKSHFIWDEYQIEFARSLLELSENLNKEEKVDLIENLVLYDNFLLRRVRDVGFRYFINRQIFTGSNEITYKRNLFGIFSKYFQSPEEIKKIIENKGLYLQMAEHPKFRTIEGDHNMVDTNFKQNLRASTLFLIKKRNEFIDNNDFLGIRATDIILTETQTGIFGMYSLMIDPNAVEGSLNDEYFKYKYQRYVIKNLKYWILYNYPNAQTFEIKHITNVADNPAIELILDLLINIFKVDNKDVVLYNSFLNYSIDIISAKWFWSLDKSLKLEYLNNLYNTDQFIKSLETWLRSDRIKRDPIIPISVNHEFFKLGFELEGIELLKSAYNLKIFSGAVQKEQLFREIGVNYREIHQYKKGAKILRDHLKKLKKKQNYEILVTKIRLAELLWLHGDEQAAQKLISSLSKKIDLQSIYDKINLKSNLASLYQKKYKFDEELRLLTEIMKFANNKNIHLREAIKDRFDILLNWKLGHITTEQLFNLQYYDEIEKYMNKGLIAFESFFFMRAIEHLSLAIKILNMNINGITVSFPDNDKQRVIIYFYRGESYTYLSDFKNALDDYIDLIKINNKHHNSMSMIILLKYILDEQIGVEYTTIIEEYNSNDMMELTKYFVENIFRVSSLNLLNELLDYLKLSLQISKQEYYINTEFYLDVADKLADLGLQDEALVFYDKGLQLNLRDNVRRVYLTNIGTVYANMDEHRKAIEKYNEAMKLASTDIEKAFIFGNIGASYGSIMEYEMAIFNIEKSIKLFGQNQEFSEIIMKRAVELNMYKQLIDEKLLINRIPKSNRLALKFFKTGELTFQHYVKNQKFRSLDASSIISYHSKGIERLLYEELLQGYLIQLNEEFELILPNNLISSSNSILKRIIREYQQGKEMSLTLGQWVHINNNSQDTLNSHFNSYLESVNKFTVFNEIVELLKDSIITGNNQSIINLRNNISHIMGISFDEFISLRKNIISVINRIIDLLFILE